MPGTEAWTLHAVLPGDIDDPALVSGGNVYDRRVLDGLTAHGATVREHPLPGAWPRPDDAARWQLDAVLRAVGDDAVVLLDGLVACGVPEVVVPHAHRRRLAVLVHLPLGEEQPDLDAGEGAVLRAAGAVIATSDWAARRLTARHGLARLTVATPGADPAPLAPGTDGVHRLLCLGALSPTKGQDLLVAALAQLRADPWTLDLVGPTRRDPAFVARLRATIAREGLTERVRLPGPRTGVDLDATWRATDLLVTPSRVETYGMAVTEALARGIPVVASDVGGLPDALADAGVLTPAGDVPALAAAVRRWLRDPAHRERLRTSARARRRTLSTWGPTSRAVARVLADLVASDVGDRR